MLKYVAVPLLSLTLSAIHASSQSSATPVNAVQAQKIAAEREAMNKMNNTMNNALSSDPHQRLEQTIHRAAEPVTD
jgi:hypothetical protein